MLPFGTGDIPLSNTQVELDAKMNVGRFVGYIMFVLAAVVSVLPLYYGATHSKHAAYDPNNLSELQEALRTRFLIENSTLAARVEVYVPKSGGADRVYRLGDSISLNLPEFMLPNGNVILTRGQQWEIAEYTLVKNPFFPFFGQELVFDKDRYAMAENIIIGTVVSVVLFLVVIGFAQDSHQQRATGGLVFIAAIILVMGSIHIEAVTFDERTGTRVLQMGSISILTLTLTTIGFYLLGRYPAKTAVPAASAV